MGIGLFLELPRFVSTGSMKQSVPGSEKIQSFLISFMTKDGGIAGGREAN